MLAQCARCQSTFQADRYGRQFCPRCGAEVVIAEPGAPAPPMAPQEQAIPFERRAELGFLRAYIDTWKEVVMRPTPFFASMRVDRNEGGILYYWLTHQLAMVLVAPLIYAVSSGAFGSQAWDSETRLGPGGALTTALGSFVFLPLFSLVGLFIYAGLVHLALMMVGGNKRGFTATLKTFCYAGSPLIVMGVPCLGWFAGLWAEVLLVIGLGQAQRCGGGKAAFAVLLPMLLLCCLCGAFYAAIAAAAFSAMGPSALGAL